MADINILVIGGSHGFTSFFKKKCPTSSFFKYHYLVRPIINELKTKILEINPDIIFIDNPPDPDITIPEIVKYTRHIKKIAISQEKIFVEGIHSTLPTNEISSKKLFQTIIKRS